MKNSPWYDIRNAMEESPTCLQTDFIRQYAVIGSEDCLYLNVYSPKVIFFKTNDCGAHEESKKSTKSGSILF